MNEIYGDAKWSEMYLSMLDPVILTGLALDIAKVSSPSNKITKDDEDIFLSLVSKKIAGENRYTDSINMGVARGWGNNGNSFGMELAHDEWLKAKLIGGWGNGEFNEVDKKHPDILPFSSLPWKTSLKYKLMGVLLDTYIEEVHRHVQKERINEMEADVKVKLLEAEKDRATGSYAGSVGPYQRNLNLNDKAVVDSGPVYVNKGTGA